jgi:hypothetical protein
VRELSKGIKSSEGWDNDSSAMRAHGFHYINIFFLHLFTLFSCPFTGLVGSNTLKAFKGRGGKGILRAGSKNAIFLGRRFWVGGGPSWHLEAVTGNKWTWPWFQTFRRYSNVCSKPDFQKKKNYTMLPAVVKAPKTRVSSSWFCDSTAIFYDSGVNL